MQKYWRNFGRLISAADTGAVITCIGWIFFWLDHIPEHIFHTHFLVPIIFTLGVGFGCYGTFVMITNRGYYGTPIDRVSLAFQIIYTLLGSLSGLAAGFIWPPN